MLTGPQALAALQDALADIRREETEVTHKLGRRAERTVKIRETRGEMLCQLGRLTLSDADQSALFVRIATAEKATRDALAVHAEALRAGETALSALDAEIVRLAESHAGTLEAIAAQQDQINRLSNKIAASIEARAAYVDQHETAIRLAAASRAAMARSVTSQADRQDNIRPYRDDPLFAYLWARGYGTPTYSGRGPIAWLDGRVASLIGYGRARHDYMVFDALPACWRAHAERTAEAARATAGAAATLQADAIDAAGGATARHALDAARVRIAMLGQEMVIAQDKRDRALDAQCELAQGAEPNLNAAIAGLDEILTDTLVTNMLDATGQSGTAQSGKIVAQVDDVKRRLADEADDAEKLGGRLAILATRRRALEDIEYEFKASRFDDPACVFEADDLVGSALDAFLTGAISATTYWQAWCDSQRWRPSAWAPAAVARDVPAPDTGQPGPVPAEARFSRPRPVSEEAPNPPASQVE